MVETKPDIDFATFVISYFTKNPSQQHTKVVITIIRYLKAIKIQCIMYSKKKRGDFIIKGYSDLY